MYKADKIYFHLFFSLFYATARGRGLALESINLRRGAIVFRKSSREQDGHRVANTITDGGRVAVTSPSGYRLVSLK